MTRFTLSSLLAVVAAAVAFAASAGARPAMSHPKLLGNVGQGGSFKITLKTASGKLVKRLKAGTYTFVIHDFGTIHNFELDGPHGKSWTFTSVPFVGMKTRTLKLSPGKYKAYCKTHEPTMFQFFTVK